MLISIAVVPFAVLIAARGTLFSVLFGYDCYQAGIFAQILALWMLIVFFTNPISTLVSRAEDEYSDIYSQVSYFDSWRID